MKNVNKYFKIWLIVTIAVFVVGVTLLGVLGLNKNADVGTFYEVQVEVGAAVNDDGAKIIKDSSKKYLKDNGNKVISYATQTVGDGEKVIFKINNPGDVTEVNKLIDGLETSVMTALSGIGVYDVTVGVYQSKDHGAEEYAMASAAFAIVIVAVFVYYAFMEKLSGAATVLSTMAISLGLFVALTGMLRIPAEPYFVAGIAFVTALTGIMSGGVINRCRELIKNVGNDKKTYEEISDIASWSSLTRFAVIDGSLKLVAILLLVFGSAIVKFMALQIILATGVATFTSYVWTAILWSTFKKIGKGKKRKAVESDKTLA